MKHKESREFAAATLIDDTVVHLGPAGSRDRASWLQRLKRTSSRRFSQAILVSLLQVADALAVAALGLAIYFGYVGAQNTSAGALYAALAACVGLSVPVSLQLAGAYTIRILSNVTEQLIRNTAVICALFLALVAGLFLLKLGDSVSRVWLVSWFAASLTAVNAMHLVLRHKMRSWHAAGLLSTRVVIVGGGRPAEELIRSVRESAANQFVEFVGVFDDREDTRSPGRVAGLPKLGTIRELAEFARAYSVDMLVLTLPMTAENRLLQIMKQLWILPVDIRLSAHAQRMRFRPRTYSWLGNVPLIDVFDRPLHDWALVVKAIEDRLLAGLALVALSPVMMAVAIAVKLESRGPVLFRQVRYGFNNQPINVYKFRSMYVDKCDARADRLVTRDDPRVTRVGRFIRRTSLDELPQLLNVLKGDLSLVGPRPHAAQAKAADKLYDQVVEGYFARHRVKPGITGWAQINGWRGETDTAEKIQRRVEYDLYYIENWSLAFDLQILAATPFALLKSENAY